MTAKSPYNSKFANISTSDSNLERWLPETTGRYKDTYEVRARTTLKIFFEQLEATNDPTTALRNTVDTVAPFGIQKEHVLAVTYKWRAAHGLSRLQVYPTRTVRGHGYRLSRKTRDLMIKLVSSLNNDHNFDDEALDRALARLNG